MLSQSNEVLTQILQGLIVRLEILREKGYITDEEITSKENELKGSSKSMEKDKIRSKDDGPVVASSDGSSNDQSSGQSDRGTDQDEGKESINDSSDS